MGSARVVRRKLGHAELEATADDGEQIVEIVCDATRKPADGLHLLRVDQLGFEPLSVRDVRERRHDVDDLASSAAQRVRRDVELESHATRAFCRDFALERTALRFTLSAIERALSGSGNSQSDRPRTSSSLEQPQSRRNSCIGVNDEPRGIGHRNADQGRSDGLILEAERVLHSFGLGNVREGHEQLLECAGRVADCLCRDPEMERRAVHAARRHLDMDDALVPDSSQRGGRLLVQAP